MYYVRLAASALLVTIPIASVLADDAPPPPPQHEWYGKAQLGFLDSKGNADAESINANLDALRNDGPWKNEIYLAALYGKSNNLVAAERYEGHTQTNYDLTQSFYTFGSLRFEHDQFDGFQYQWSATGGIGYKIFDTDATKLNVQAGVGYRRLRPENIIKDADGVVIERDLYDAQGEAVGTLGVDFSHAFNKSTVLTDKFYGESGSDNTMLHDEIALTVKMSTKLALSVGYQVTDNTSPPAGLKKVDELTTVNLVYSWQ